MASDCRRHFNEGVEIMWNGWLNDETGEGETMGVNMTQVKPGIVLSNKATFTMTSRQGKRIIWTHFLLNSDPLNWLFPSGLQTQLTMEELALPAQVLEEKEVVPDKPQAASSLFVTVELATKESKSQPMFANGVSFESWILGEGLYKVRKMGLHNPVSRIPIRMHVQHVLKHTNAPVESNIMLSTGIPSTYVILIIATRDTQRRIDWQLTSSLIFKTSHHPVPKLTSCLLDLSTLDSPFPLLLTKSAIIKSNLPF
ncbi:unnamed protein product [Orchesella dallaii]|uniref:Uncharacterized protein n=1 Tax=Orchesella dallaii TaxID=48710 RepID=A0ABP1PMZ6_9HEXA